MNYELFKACLYLIIWGYAGVIMICSITILISYSITKVSLNDKQTRMFNEKYLYFDISLLIYSIGIATSLFIAYLTLQEYRNFITIATIINTAWMHRNVSKVVNKIRILYE